MVWRPPTAEPEPEPKPWTREFKATMDDYFKGDAGCLVATPRPPHEGGGCACGACPRLPSRRTAARPTARTCAAPPAPAAPAAPLGDGPPAVVIIGAGIGGLAAALALTARGVRVAVYERDAGCRGRRGYGLTLSNASALAALGLEDEVRAINTTCVSNCHWVFDATGAALGYFGAAFRRVTASPAAFAQYASGKRGNLRVPRHVLRRMLFERLPPGTVRWGWTLESYDDDAVGVTAHLRRVGGEPAEPEVAEARGALLVGADGVCCRPPPPTLSHANCYVVTPLIRRRCGRACGARSSATRNGGRAWCW